LDQRNCRTQKSGKQKPNYRWNYEEFTDTIYQEHLEGKVSVGIQPTNESGDSRFWSHRYRILKNMKTLIKNFI